MRISAEHNKRLKKITMIVLCAVIAVCLLIKPVQRTIAYITATSVTCTNTFSNGTPTEPTEPTEPTDPTKPTEPTDPTKPTEPTKPTDPTKPSGTESTPSSGTGTAGSQIQGDNASTNDSFRPGVWGAMVGLSLIAVIATVAVGRRKRSKASEK